VRDAAPSDGSRRLTRPRAAVRCGPSAGRLELGEGAPPPARACASFSIAARTYADIEGALIHGEIDATTRVAVADVVSFAFAKAAGG
jgi:hypothetical protein